MLRTEWCDGLCLNVHIPFRKNACIGACTARCPKDNTRDISGYENSSILESCLNSYNFTHFLLAYMQCLICLPLLDIKELQCWPLNTSSTKQYSEQKVQNAYNCRTNEYTSQRQRRWLPPPLWLLPWCRWNANNRNLQFPHLHVGCPFLSFIGIKKKNVNPTYPKNTAKPWYFLFFQRQWTLLVITQNNYYHTTFLDYE